MSFLSGDNQVTETKAPDQTNQASTENWLSKIVEQKGEQWKNPEVLAKGYASSQEYIKDLERQVNELREDVGKQGYAEELLKKLREAEGKPPAREASNSGAETDGGAKSGNTNLDLSEDKLKTLIQETLTRTESEKTVKQNLADADARLLELYGTEVKSKVTEKANELGISVERLREIAGESPGAFFRLIGEDTKSVSPVTKGTLNTAASGFDSRGSERNFQFYQKMRRENSKHYYSPKVQQDMLQDRLRLGDKFYN